jgi:hypothetical protein
MTDETHRFYRFSNKSTYEALTTASDAARGFPNDTAQRWLPVWDELFVDPETTTDRLYCIKRRNILDTDDFTGEGILEIDLETYLERLHWEEPVEEDLEMIDDLQIDEPWTN